MTAPGTATASPHEADARGEAIVGWKAIASHLQASERSARTWVHQAEDPLPVRWRLGEPRAWAGYLNDWQARRRGLGLRVQGWEAICSRLGGVSPATARAWARQALDRLPVHGVGKRRPWIYATALRDWIHRTDRPFQDAARTTRHEQHLHTEAP